MWFDDLTKTFFDFNKRSSLSSGTCYTICNWWSLISPNSYNREVREQPCGLWWVRTRPAHYESKSSIRYAIINSDIINSDKTPAPPIAPFGQTVDFRFRAGPWKRCHRFLDRRRDGCCQKHLPPALALPGFEPSPFS